MDEYEFGNGGCMVRKYSLNVRAAKSKVHLENYEHNCEQHDGLHR